MAYINLTQESVKIELEDEDDENITPKDEDSNKTVDEHFHHNDEINSLKTELRVLNHKLNLAAGEKENALSNMKKLNRCLQVQKVSFKEKENLLLEEKRKNKTLKTNVSELNEKLAASEQSIQNLKEQQDLMLSLDVQNCSKNDSSSNALEEKLKNEIDQLKNELNATKSTKTLFKTTSLKNVIFQTTCPALSNFIPFKETSLTDAVFTLIKEGPDWYRIFISNSNSNEEFSFNTYEDEYEMTLFDSICKFNFVIKKGFQIIVNLSGKMNNLEVLKSAHFIFGFIFKNKNNTQSKSKQSAVISSAPACGMESSLDLIFQANGSDFTKIHEGCSNDEQPIKEGVFRLFKVKKEDSYLVFIDGCGWKMEFKFDSTSYSRVFLQFGTLFHIHFSFPERIIVSGNLKDNETLLKLKKIMLGIVPKQSTAIKSIFCKEKQTRNWQATKRSFEKSGNIFIPSNKISRPNNRSSSSTNIVTRRRSFVPKKLNSLFSKS